MKAAFACAAALALAGCDMSPDPLNWTNVPNDPEVREYVFQRCLRGATGPSHTQYNDWDEAIKACGAHAERISRYCPEGASCNPNVSITRADVRAVLPPKPEHPSHD